ncbi:MAG TPA: hypothetical protein VK979_10045 [Guyparkeria sp.]|nr:hypothetical protein [Guyparkeria sp.]
MSDPNPPAGQANPSTPRRGMGCLGIGLIVLGTILVTLLVAAIAARFLLFPNHFKPVQLNVAEQQALDQKLAVIGIRAERELSKEQPPSTDRFAPRPEEFDASGRLRPEIYQEASEQREVRFGERELNALIASDPEMARRLAIALSDDLVSAKLLVPLPPDLPIMGGQTLRLTAGAEVRQRPGPDGKPRLAVIVTGVSLWGIPLPNAWIGGLRGIDLVEQFGDDPGFWQALDAGVESVRVEDGELVLQLAE